MRSHSAFLTAVLLSMWPALHALADTPVALLTTKELNESYTDEAPVSGRVVAGVGMVGNRLLKQIFIAPPLSGAGNSVCVQIMSRDGRYWSENTFTLPKTINTTPVILEYPSKHQALLFNLGADDLALLGYAGECNRSKKGTLFLAGRADAITDDMAIRFYINSARADTYLSVTNSAAHRKPARCTKLLQGRRTGYDTVCTLPVSGLEKSLTTLQIKILRRRYERMLPPTQLTLVLPEKY